VSIIASHFYLNSGTACIAVFSGEVDARRNLLFDNTSQVCIGVFNGRAEIVNNTLVDNRGGITVSKGLPVVRNNIVVRGSSYGLSFAAGQVPPSPQFIDYNLVWSNHPDYAGAAFAGPHDLSEEPAFVDADRSVFRLAASSPCIDAGDPDSAYNDPDGSRNDMGAIPYTGLDSESERRDGSIIDLVKLIDEAMLGEDKTTTAANRSEEVRELIDVIFRQLQEVPRATPE